MTHETSSLTFEADGVQPYAASGSAQTVCAVVRATASGVELTLIAAMWLLLPVWPLLASAIARDGQYLRRYWSTLGRMTHHIRAQRRSRSIARMVTQKLTPRALRQTQRLGGACTHCGRCCLDRACLFLSFDAQGRSSCRIYGGRVWRALACGQYPSDARDIALYGCPSFTVVRGPAAISRDRVQAAPAPKPVDQTA